MIYLPGTNAWIAYLNPGSSRVKERFRSHAVDVIVCSSVVKAELLYGAHRSARRTENLYLLDRPLSAFPSVPFDDAAAAIYGSIRADLAARGLLIGPNDLLIAASALANDLTLVTHNVREFARISSLRLDEWVIADLGLAQRDEA